MRHTPEPWDTTESGLTIKNVKMDQIVCEAIVEVSRQKSIADMARIKSCVNACAGIENPEDLRRQRDELILAIGEGRRAIGEHFAPNDCYATGPLTGDPIRDLVECPACSFISMYDAVIAKIKVTQ